MRKVIVSMNITLDGFMAGPDCELDWHFNRWSADMGESLAMELSKTDIVLLGRVTYQAMARYWPMRAVDRSLARIDIPFAHLINEHQKVVYSNTMQTTDWNNSVLIKGDLKKAITELKRSGNGKNGSIIVYGSGKLVTALIKYGLVDEYQLWVHPVILGKGKSLFMRIKDQSELTFVGSLAFESGVVLLYYKKV